MKKIENTIAIKKVKNSDLPEYHKKSLIAYYTKLDSFGLVEMVPDLSKYNDFHPIHAMI